jgi:hypothetical protein
MKSASGFATCVAAIITVLVTPGFYELTSEFVGRVAMDAYGESAARFWQLVYFVLLFPTVFFALRASLATAIVAGATWAAIRFV